MSTVYLADADSTIPNLALMRLATYFRDRGDSVRFLRPGDRRTLFDPIGDVFGSSIFKFARREREAIEQEWGLVRWGGTGVNNASSLTEVDTSVDWDAVTPDYSLYPGFTPSVGFLTRGCRLRCGFCVVPEKEGRPRVASSVARVWRGEGHPKQLLLLDNDAFAKPLRAFWRDALDEMGGGNFRVCFSQGINLRLLDDEAAAMIATTPYYATDFEHRTLYTAWDNLRDEGIFRAGVERLRAAGVPPHRLMVYMLVGYDPKETWEAIHHRFNELVALGCDPFPMVYDQEARPDLCAFKRWARSHLYRTVPWTEFRDRRINHAQGESAS